jgi:hypothetical protein
MTGAYQNTMVMAQALAAPARQRAHATDRALGEERAARACNRAQVVGFAAVLRALAKTHPDAVREAIEVQYGPAYLSRAAELGLAQLLTDGQAGVVRNARAALTAARQVLE